MWLQKALCNTRTAFNDSIFCVKNACQIVDEMVKKAEHQKEDIEILEMDELYTYIKKKRVKHEYGLLLIGIEEKMLCLK